MPGCELCGRKETSSKAIVEGVTMNVCSNCSKYGKVLQEKKVNIILPTREETIEDLISNYSQTIKHKREAQGLSQKELAEKLAQKESLLAKIEQGHLEPTLEIARKIEKVLGITLVIKRLNPALDKKQETANFTIGDLIKKK